MNEMQMVRDLLTEPPSPPSHVSAEALRSLQDGIAGRRSPASRLGRFRRPAWGLGLAGAVTAAALVATTVVTGPSDQRAEGVAQQEVPGSQTPAVKLDARTVLLAAADRSAGQPDQAGAYWHSAQVSRHYHRTGSATDRYTVYTETRDEGWTPSTPGRDRWGRQKDLGTRPASPADEATWRRAGSPTKFAIEVPVPAKHGERPGGQAKRFVAMAEPRGGGELSHSPLTDGDKVYWLGRNVTMKDLRGLPTDPARLKAWLLRSYAGHGTESTSDKMSSDQWLFVVAGGLIIDMPVTPQVRAAAFRMLAALKSVKAVGPVKDSQGRAGTAVTIVERTKGNGVLEHRLLIDEVGGRALGKDIVIREPAGANANLPAGSLMTSSVVVADEWVDSPPR
ncbi:CU044_5270 family protein [Actinomadura alba]|uniref:CU044_5270 family protein n=1 Tax=Actinomadura alba TaxID=406431 RepID=A0ABR7LQF0_9ACTN|nr:CU044_5270 family protein [Actinomadura alba]MBC6466893.1 CU044_5270 family protein [Actinomadura alba]